MADIDPIAKFFVHQLSEVTAVSEVNPDVHGSRVLKKQLFMKGNIGWS